MGLLKELEELEQWYFADTDIKGKDLNSKPSTVYSLAERLMAYGGRELMVVDIGSGHGFVQNALRYAGWLNARGVEIDATLNEYNRTKAAQMGLSAPKIIETDYTRPDLFSLPFDDGIVLKNADFLFHYSYTLFGAHTMLFNVMAGPNGAKEGSRAWLTELPDWQVKRSGYEMLKPPVSWKHPFKKPFFDDPCVVKTSSPNTRVNVIESESRYPGHRRARLVYS